jgi:hypothetical protein
LALHNTETIPARGSGNPDLRVTVVRIAPASTFEKAMHGGNSTKGDPRRQIAVRIDHTAPTLAHVQSFSARVLARGRATSWPNSVHEQHARAMIVFQIVDVGLETCSVGDADTGTRASLVRNDDPLVAVGIEYMRLLWLWLWLRSLRLQYLLRLLCRLLWFCLLRILSLFRLRLSLLRVLQLLF